MSATTERLHEAGTYMLEALELVESALRTRGPDKWFPIEVRLKVQDAIRKAKGE